MKGFPLEPELIPIPIVLNIRLDEDCMYKVDEDYVQFLGRPLDKEKKISGRRKGKNKIDNVVCWDKFGSAAILKDGGIDGAEVNGKGRIFTGAYPGECWRRSVEAAAEIGTAKKHDGGACSVVRSFGAIFENGSSELRESHR